MRPLSLVCSSLFFLALPSLAKDAPAERAPTNAEVGAPAPDFQLLDWDGKPRSLSEFRGKIVVLEWTNRDCPFVVKFYKPGKMQELQREATKEGVVWLTINSSAPGKQGYFDGPSAKAHMQAQRGAQTAYLLDPDGKVGKLYGAQTTPHMYVIDPKGTLVYMGAIDDKRSTSSGDIATAKNYVTTAIAELRAGRPISTPMTRAYGCSVKYAGS